MKRLFVVVIAALSLSGCAAGLKDLSFGRPEKGADQGVVVSFMRFDDEPGARLYLARKSVNEADALASIQRAREEVARERAKCAGTGDCAAIAAAVEAAKEK
jgi:hypothetical protein